MISEVLVNLVYVNELQRQEIYYILYCAESFSSDSLLKR